MLLRLLQNLLFSPPFLSPLFEGRFFRGTISNTCLPWLGRDCQRHGSLSNWKKLREIIRWKDTWAKFSSLEPCSSMDSAYTTTENDPYFLGFLYTASWPPNSLLPNLLLACFQSHRKHANNKLSRKIKEILLVLFLPCSLPLFCIFFFSFMEYFQGWCGELVQGLLLRKVLEVVVLNYFPSPEIKSTLSMDILEYFLFSIFLFF